MTPVTVKLTRYQLDYMASAIVARLITAQAATHADLTPDDWRVALAVNAVERFGFSTRTQIMSTGRAMPGVFGRAVAIWLVRQVWGIPYGRIARAFKRSDHATAMAACRTVEDRRATDLATQRWTDQAREWVSEESLKRNSLTS